EAVLVHHPLMPEVVLTAPRQLGERHRYGAAACRFLDRGHAGGDDFLADAVAGDDPDRVRLVRHVSSCARLKPSRSIARLKPSRSIARLNPSRSIARLNPSRPISNKR